MLRKGQFRAMACLSLRLLARLSTGLFSTKPYSEPHRVLRERLRRRACFAWVAAWVGWPRSPAHRFAPRRRAPRSVPKGVEWLNTASKDGPLRRWPSANSVATFAAQASADKLPRARRLCAGWFSLSAGASGGRPLLVCCVALAVAVSAVAAAAEAAAAAAVEAEAGGTARAGSCGLIGGGHAG